MNANKPEYGYGKTEPAALTEVELCHMRLAALLRSISQAVCLLDGKGTVIAWNQAAERLYTIPAKVIVGQPLECFFSLLSSNHYPKDRLLIITDEDELRLEKFSAFQRYVQTAKADYLTAMCDGMDLAAATRQMERQTIISVLETTGYNKAAAARQLNVPRSTLYYKMNLYGIQEQSRQD